MQKRRLTVYNTLTKKRERFKPKNDDIVKIFTCGPSVYRTQHIGNYRTFLFEDILLRYLELSGYRVKRVINFTDVEDKALVEAGRKGISLEKLTRPVIEEFNRDCARLHIKLPRSMPRSSTSVKQAAELIGILLNKGTAYRYRGNIYFDPLKYAHFGELFGLDMSKWPKKKIRFSKDTYNGLRWNLGDFILWHGYREGDLLCWDTEIGRGRPAWNIQDAAMIYKELGTEADFCCGGIDNLYRHHDYNRAVMESVSGKEFAHYWLHGEHVLYNAKKMAKSKGNVIYAQDLVEKGYSGEQIRFFLMYGHYRKKLNYTEKNFKRAAAVLDRLKRKIADLFAILQKGENKKSGQNAAGTVDGTRGPEFLGLFYQCMNDDFQIKIFINNVDKKLNRLLKDRAQLKKLNAAALREELTVIDSVLKAGLTR
ncbi:MAG: class I tRNA ligase family protein [Spirochaetales bacterium]|nr:class I tRNA ligase family protein [Spirochaetales bacterium]